MENRPFNSALPPLPAKWFAIFSPMPFEKFPKFWRVNRELRKFVRGNLSLTIHLLRSTVPGKKEYLRTVRPISISPSTTSYWPKFICPPRLSRIYCVRLCYTNPHPPPLTIRISLDVSYFFSFPFEFTSPCAPQYDSPEAPRHIRERWITYIFSVSVHLSATLVIPPSRPFFQFLFSNLNSD